MNLVSVDNLNNYLNQIAHELGWDVQIHRKVYNDVFKAQNIDLALDVLENRVFHWFIRNGRIVDNWRPMIKNAVQGIKEYNYKLPDLQNKNTLGQIVKVIKPLGKIKETKSKNENYMVASKILNFLFPDLFPKIDSYWIKGVCLRKVNESDIYSNKFRISSNTDLWQYSQYLKFAAQQDYGEALLLTLENYIGIKNAYAVAFEYCLLGFSKNEILEKKKKGNIKSKSC